MDLLSTWAAMGWDAVFCVSFSSFRPPALILLSDPDEKQRRKITWPKYGNQCHLD